MISGLLFIFIGWLCDRFRKQRNSLGDLFFYIGYLISYPFFYLSSYCHFWPLNIYYHFVLTRSQELLTVE